jgi:hypothetical protein
VVDLALGAAAESAACAGRHRDVYRQRDVVEFRFNV